MPPARCRSVATNRPPGLRSASVGTLRLIASKSSIVSGRPDSRAIASRCSTALVEPPLVSTAVMAFSSDSRVMMDFGVRLDFTSSITSRPASRPTSALAGSVAGTEPLPIGAMPRNSIAIAIVLAVNCPPQAPAPGHAWSSRSFSSASVILPAACAPMPS